MITLHIAFVPQDPGQGSTHFSRIQALLLVHSELIIHSGRQFGGEPKYKGKHEHDGLFPMFLHCEFAPHGEGTHGSLITAGVDICGGAKG